MKPGKARSLIFFVLLFAVAALALDASYAQGRGSGGQQKQQMPQQHQQMMMKRAESLGIGEMLQEQKNPQEQ